MPVGTRSRSEAVDQPGPRPEPDPSAPELRGTDLSLGYHGTKVVSEASIRLHRGRVTALVGPNGSGKSTLLRALARLHKPDAGEVRLADDASVFDLTPKAFARRVTLLAQSRPTPNGICVRDVVGYGRHPYRGSWRSHDPDGAEAIGWAMDVTGVEEMADRAVDELSGGELQRVWLATSLAQQTEVLLLDEPTTFLDLRYQMEILDLIRDLADQHEVAIGVVLHDLNHAASVADQIVLLNGGRVHAVGAPGEVLTSPLLSETYGIQIDVTSDATTQQLTTRPIGRHTRRMRTTK